VIRRLRTITGKSSCAALRHRTSGMCILPPILQPMRRRTPVLQPLLPLQVAPGAPPLWSWTLLESMLEPTSLLLAQPTPPSQHSPSIHPSCAIPPPPVFSPGRLFHHYPCGMNNMAWWVSICELTEYVTNA
jgi:hypothetical protein